MLDKTIAKRVDNGEWVEGYYVETSTYYGDEYAQHFIIPRDSDSGVLIDRFCKVHPTTVRKYAGTTKGGQEVYGGSILEYDGFRGVVKWADGSQKYGTGMGANDYPIGFVVEWEASANWWRSDLGFWLNEREVNVIGNIIDNSDLLGE
jgi:hypothetical protein